MSTRPSISVILPVYNAERWLKVALESILAQSHEDWELLSLDDGSSDGSSAILASYASRDRRIRLLESHPSRLGVVASANALLAAAKAPLVARMDADDIAAPQRLELQIAALNADTTLAGVASRVEALADGVRLDGMKRYLAWQNQLLEPSDINRDRFIECPMTSPSISYRCEAIRDQLGGWRDVGWAEDWDLLLRAFELGLRFSRLPEHLLQWRIHPAQATRVHPRYSRESFVAARAHFLARFLTRRLASLGQASLWLIGAGPVGKGLARALADEGAAVAGFVDIDTKKIGGIVRYGEQRWPVVAMDEFTAIRPRRFAISAVGSPGARRRIRAWLGAAGWSEELDFVVAA